MARIFAHLTCTRVEYHGDGCDDYTEKHGWIDPGWSRTEPLESRNDTPPVVDCSHDDPDLADHVRDALATHLPGPIHDNGDGTFHAGTEHTSADDAGSYTYALHFICKDFHPVTGWRERPWCPTDDGHIDLGKEVSP